MVERLELDATIRALADRTRRALLERLTDGPASVSELAKPFDVSLAAIVQHVQVLQECGLIRTEKIGRTRVCHLESAGLEPLADWLARRRGAAERRLDRLGEYLAEGQDAGDQDTEGDLT